jgi:hypothetical protein
VLTTNDKAPDKSGALAIPLAGGTSTIPNMCAIPLRLSWWVEDFDALSRDFSVEEVERVTYR